MDKKSLLAISLITIIFIVWMLYVSINTQHPSLEEQKRTKLDSIKKRELVEKHKDSTLNENSKSIEKDNKKDDTSQDMSTNSDSLEKVQKYGQFYKFNVKEEDIITIETDLYKAKLSSKGGSLVKFFLKNYSQWNGYKTQLIWSNDPMRKGELYLTFVTKDAKNIDTRDLNFEFINVDKKYYRVSKDNKLTIRTRLSLEDDKYIEKSYTFYGNEYIFDNKIILKNLEDVLTTRGYNYEWSDGLKYQEKSSADESSRTNALASLNGETIEIDATDEEPVEETATGFIDFAGIKTKYFGVALIPINKKKFDGTVDLYGFNQKVNKDGIVERYNISYRVPYLGGTDEKSFRVYLGPLDYDIVNNYGLSQMIYFGWWIIRYIGEYLILPLFLLIHKIIPDWGITIIAFSIIIKFLLYPLSIQQMRTSQKMKLLGPEMEKIREKYKDDNTAQQKAMMKLYSDYGINPAGGCLPLLLQMPILFALWSVLSTAIDLRQASFILWITDLSLPDVLFHLPFSLLGIKFVSGLALLMGVTMFIQQKLTITDPKQKAMIYLMPILFTLIFSNLPSGLNLYYFVFNLLGIIQQIWINNFSKNQMTLEELKRAPKKESWFQKKMREAQEIAESQGRSVPGKYGTTQKPHPTKKKKRK